MLVLIVFNNNSRKDTETVRSTTANKLNLAATILSTRMTNKMSFKITTGRRLEQSLIAGLQQERDGRPNPRKELDLGRL